MMTGWLREEWIWALLVPFILMEMEIFDFDGNVIGSMLEEYVAAIEADVQEVILVFLPAEICKF